MRKHSEALSVFALVIICTCHRALVCSAQPLVKAIFNFGDSTTDTGTNSYLPNPAFLANFTPYGQTYFNRPTGRFSDGRLVIDILAAFFKLPLLLPYLTPNFTYYDNGVNFASAGSGLLDSTKAGMVVNIREQVQQFVKVKESLVSTHGSLSVKLSMARSLFTISSGSNDIYYSYFPNQTSPETFTDTMINELEKTLTALHAEGANKFVLVGLSPLGCVPSQVLASGECNESLNQIARLYNKKLSAFQLRITIKLLGSIVVVANVYDTLDGLIKNGEIFGFTQGSNACCGGGPFRGAVGNQCGFQDSAGNDLFTKCTDEELDHYVFWDFFHPTDRAYQTLAALFLFVFCYHVQTQINAMPVSTETRWNLLWDSSPITTSSSACRMLCNRSVKNLP
ncbi:hypothetical protein MPTK1_3g20230 [Marchantia polymorpha subsp. ruderalis]|uniref:Uncharacterized protein n=2 Tax=Marchantia polymorpha TaxID=3197 RepID=A0AAF6B2V1_MARPO|nr:hypothetical protein MARPO_0049s0010 [Marchantia polymorpha]BBN06335.1 hypothetical protein Mp_3g20230 [Marchantia polymorpha subsp. ruderalis]|eukprot:PTQ38706.1 hypothetical protein MARPO_0049s0010 [Marchantia polymorpha]